MAYDMYLGAMLMPVTPSSLDLKINNKNSTMTLIDAGEINVLKDAGLTEISFTALLPQREYSFATYKSGFIPADAFIKKFEQLKTSKKPFQFIVSRKLPDGTALFDTNITVSLEKYTLTEDAGNGFDVNIKVELKQYREYSTKILTISTDGAGGVTNGAGGVTNGAGGASKIKVGDLVRIISGAKYYRGQHIPNWVMKGTYKVYQVGTAGIPDYIVVDKTGINSPFHDYDLKVVKPSTATVTNARPQNRPTSGTYTVQSGDTLWRIAKRYLGDGSKWKSIYHANKDIIEKTAKQHGKKSSSNGDLIYPGCELKIPE